MIPHELRRWLCTVLRAGMEIRCERQFLWYLWTFVYRVFVLCKNMKKLCTRHPRQRLSQRPRDLGSCECGLNLFNDFELDRETFSVSRWSLIIGTGSYIVFLLRMNEKPFFSSGIRMREQKKGDSPHALKIIFDDVLLQNAASRSQPCLYGRPRGWKRSWKLTKVWLQNWLWIDSRQAIEKKPTHPNSHLSKESKLRLLHYRGSMEIDNTSCDQHSTFWAKELKRRNFVLRVPQFGLMPRP